MEKPVLAHSLTAWCTLNESKKVQTEILAEKFIRTAKPLCLPELGI